jgi:hypothetical protein
MAPDHAAHGSASAPALVPLVPEVWTATVPFTVLQMPIGHRMTVVRLADGGLWLHSPIAHTPDLVRELRRLGPITHWVAPSRTHDLFLDGWFAGEPQAQSYGAPKLRGPHPDWKFTAWLAEDLAAPWRGELDLLPIEGAPRVGEWMFLHRPSKTAITADVLFNLGTGAGGLGGLMLRLMGTHGRARVSRLFRATIVDRPALERSLRRVLEWDFERLIVGHGEPLLEDAKGALARAFRLNH